MKKSGILLAVLALATFVLAFSSTASAQTPQAPAPAVQQSQPTIPLPDFLTAPVQTPAAAPNDSGVEWLGAEGSEKAICRCSTNSQCKNTTHLCCWFPNQHCGICCS